MSHWSDEVLVLQPSEPDVAPTGPKLRIFILTTRDRKTDFRLPIVDALQRHHEIWYVWVKRRPQVTGPGTGGVPTEMSFPAFLSFIRRVSTGDAVNVYFNSTSAAYPLIIPLMRQIAGRGVWCHDMHDDLLYDMVGLRRVRFAVSLFLQELFSDLTVRSADSLKELFPRSHHLGNASQIRPIGRGPADYRRVLILASLDKRFDFSLMSAVALACPAHEFHIHGQISRGDTGVQAALDSLLSKHANISYHGSYGLADLDDILRSYAASFAPYLTNIRLTHYIDPLRFYHCLNSGMELISSRIPQAEQWQDSIHLIRDANDVAAALANIAASPVNRRNTSENYQIQTWESRAERLIAILLAHPKTIRLLKTLP